MPLSPPLYNFTALATFYVSSSRSSSDAIVTCVVWLWRGSSSLIQIKSTSLAAIEAAIYSHSATHLCSSWKLLILFLILFDLIILELKCGARILNLKWSFFVRNCVSIKEICILPFRKFHFVTSWNEGLFCMSCPLHFTTVTCIQQKWKIFYFLDTFTFLFLSNFWYFCYVLWRRGWVEGDCQQLIYPD